MLLKAMDRAVSGMRLAESKLHASAHNTANTLTEGFARVQADGVEAREGGVEVALSSRPPEEGPDPVGEIIEQKVAAVTYRANLAVVKTAEEMLGEILDTRG